MTHKQFRPYHNTPIVFQLRDGTFGNGLLFDRAENYFEFPQQTIYEFVRVENFQKFQQVCASNDMTEIKKLTEEMDIADIVWAKCILQ